MVVVRHRALRTAHGRPLSLSDRLAGFAGVAELRRPHEGEEEPLEAAPLRARHDSIVADVTSGRLPGGADPARGRSPTSSVGTRSAALQHHTGLMFHARSDDGAGMESVGRRSRLLHVVLSARAASVALAATVLVFTAASVTVVVLNNGAGERTAHSTAVADAYQELEVALLRQEIARHDLLLEGGTTREVRSLQGQVTRHWRVVQKAADLSGRDPEAVSMRVALSDYQATIDRLVSDVDAGRSVAASEQSTDLAAGDLISRMQAAGAAHREEAASTFGQMRARQVLGARTFPVLGAVSLALVGCFIRLLALQRRRLALLRTEAHERAVTDDLTGLANRAGLRAALTAAFHPSPGSHGVALLLLDLDGFKAVNDTFGHELGDDVLKVVAGRLTESAPPSSLVVRLGGDEFVVLLPDCDQEAAMATAGLIFSALSQPTVVSSVLADVGASIGIALSRGADRRPDVAGTELLRRADVAMYTSKRSKRGPVLYSAALEVAGATSEPAPDTDQPRRATSLPVNGRPPVPAPQPRRARRPAVAP